MSRPALPALSAAGLLVLGTAACGHRDETVSANPTPRPSGTPSALATPAAPLSPSGAPSAAAGPARPGIPVTVPACASSAPAPPPRLATAKDNLAKAPLDRYAAVRVGSEAAARLIPQPEDIGPLYDRMAAPVPAGDAVFVACKADPTTPVTSAETLEITAALASTPVFFARTSPFAVAGATLAPGQPLRISASKTSETCTWSVTGFIPIPSKVCTPHIKPLQPLSTTIGPTLPAALSGPDLRVECRGLDRAGVEREARGPLAAIEQQLAEQCAAMRIDPADPSWGGPEGRTDGVLWTRGIAAVAGLLGFADPRVESAQRRAAAMLAEWQPAFGAWVRQKTSELAVGATADGGSGARYRVVAPLACGGWSFSPARETPLGVDLPKGFRACWFRLEIQNTTKAPLAVEGTLSGVIAGGVEAVLHAATTAGDRPAIYVRGVDRGSELRYVASIDESVAPGAALRLVVTAFVPEAAARATDPMLLGVGGEALLRLR